MRRPLGSQSESFQVPGVDFLGEHFRRTEQLLALCIRCLNQSQNVLAREYFLVLQEELEEQFRLEEGRVHKHYAPELQTQLLGQHRGILAFLSELKWEPDAAPPAEEQLRDLRRRVLNHLAEERSSLAQGGLMFHFEPTAPQNGRATDGRNELKVKDVMHREVLSVPLDMSITELAHTLTERKISGAPVIGTDGKLVGVVSLVDLARHASHEDSAMAPVHYPENWWKDTGIEQESLFDGFMVQDFRSATTVADIMTAAVYRVGEEADLLELVDLMLAGGIHRAVVTRLDEVVGIVTTTDLMRVLRQHLVARKA